MIGEDLGVIVGGYITSEFAGKSGMQGPNNIY